MSKAEWKLTQSWDVCLWPRAEMCTCGLHLWMKTAGFWLCITELQGSSLQCTLLYNTWWESGFKVSLTTGQLPSCHLSEITVRETHSDVIGPSSNRKNPIHILQIPSVQIVYVIGFIHCYIVKAWRCSFCHYLSALAFVVFFVLRIIWCCYLVITTRRPCCRSELQSLAHIPGLIQQNSQ